MELNKSETKNLFDVYSNASYNAGSLLEDAKLLYENKSFATSFLLACIALEELGKSQITADYINGDASKEEWNLAFHKHVFKLSYMDMWGTDHPEKLKKIGWQTNFGKNTQKLKELATYTAKDTVPIKIQWEDKAKEIIDLAVEWQDLIFHAERLNGRIGSRAIRK